MAIAAVAVTTRRAKPTIIWALTAILVGLVTILPWIFVHASKLYTGLLTLVIRPAARVGTGLLIERAQTDGLFSFGSIRYGFGSSYIYYTALVFFAAVSGLLIYLRSRRRDAPLDPSAAWSIGLCTMVLVSYLISYFIVGRYFYEWQTVHRFVVPILIAAAHIITIV